MGKAECTEREPMTFRREKGGRLFLNDIRIPCVLSYQLKCSAPNEAELTLIITVKLDSDSSE